MESTQTEQMDAAGEQLVTTTEALAEPISDLADQMQELSGKMGEMADGMARFDKSTTQLRQTHSSMDASGSTRGHAPADD